MEAARSRTIVLGRDAPGALKPVRPSLLTCRPWMTVVSASQSCSRVKWANSCKAGFLDLCTSGVLGWMYFGLGGQPWVLRGTWQRP